MLNWIKNFSKPKYHLEETERYDGTIFYVAVKVKDARKEFLFTMNGLAPKNIEWYDSSRFATNFNTIEEAEHAIQKSIWKSALEIKKDRQRVLTTKRTIKVPPWGNKCKSQ
jgi:hypothetical protein